MRIFTLKGIKLGDVWAATSWLLGHRRVALTEFTQTRTGSLPVGPLVREIESFLTDKPRIRFVAGNAGRRLTPMRCFARDYLPTKIAWHPNFSRTVCFQLDGRWKSHLKNPTPDETAALISWLEQAGWVTRCIGLPMSLEQSIVALAECAFFVGVDSGMMHVANSVGCPRLLIRNRMFDIDRAYRGKSIVTVANVGEALKYLPKCPEQGTSSGHLDHSQRSDHGPWFRKQA